MVSVVVVIHLSVARPSDDPLLNNSVFYPVWVKTVNEVKPFIPAHFRENFSSNYVRFVEFTKENLNNAKKASDLIPDIQENATKK